MARIERIRKGNVNMEYVQGADLAPLVQAGVAFMTTVVSILGVVATRWINAKVGTEKRTQDGQIRDYLNTALDRAIQYGAARAELPVPKVVTHSPTGEVIGNALPLNTDTGKAIVDAAAEFAKERVPDALAHFSIGDNNLKGMLAARLVEKAAGAALGGQSGVTGVGLNLLGSMVGSMAEHGVNKPAPIGGSGER